MQILVIFSFDLITIYRYKSYILNDMFVVTKTTLCIMSIIPNHFVATLALGSRPRQRACKGAGQEGSLGVTSHAPGNVGECEGMNPHTPK
jgi:hypothetical protein